MSTILIIEQTLNGLQFGLMLFLLAAGLTLVFGIMDMINLAHGSLYMVGAYLMATLSQATGSFVTGLVLAVMTMVVLVGGIKSIGKVTAGFVPVMIVFYVLGAVWILIANGWMQNPVGAEFNWQTMRMEMTDFWTVVFNPDAQAKFVHTVSAGYITASMFVLGVSAWYLLRGRHVALAKRSIAVASLSSAKLSRSIIATEKICPHGLARSVPARS